MTILVAQGSKLDAAQCAYLVINNYTEEIIFAATTPDAVMMGVRDVIEYPDRYGLPHAGFVAVVDRPARRRMSVENFERWTR